MGDAEQALRAIAAEDPAVEQRARLMFDGLTAGGGLAAVSQHSLQEELWYRLPSEGGLDADDCLADAHALGALFTRLGRPRYAAICTSGETAGIIRAYEADERAGRRASRKAMERSGVEPPDLEDFAWGSTTGIDETLARQSCAIALETAIEAGRLRPATRGWRAEQRRVVGECLDAPRADRLDESLRMAIVTERAAFWVTHLGQERFELLDPVVNQLLAPVEPPADPAGDLGPLQWVLDHAAEGIPLTQNHTLGRAFVVEMTDRFGWRLLDSAPRSESDSPDVHTTHALARAVGAVRRRGRTLLLTSTGKALRADPVRLWRAAMQSLCPGEDFSAAVGELALAVLLHAGHATPAQVAEAVAVGVGHRWRDGNGRAPGLATVRHHLWDTLRPALLLGVVAETGRWPDERLLVVPDDAGVREALRARAVGPLHHP